MFRFIKWLIGFFVWLSIFMFIIYCCISVFFPIKYMDSIEKYSAEYNLEPALVCAIIKTESNFQPEVTSNKGAMGLMQLMPATVDWAVTKIPIENFSYATINDPDTNIKIGCWVLNFLGEQFGDNDELISAAYNAGSGTVSKWLGNTTYSKDGEYLSYIPYGETANYVKKVKVYEQFYSFMLGVGWFA